MGKSVEQTLKDLQNGKSKIPNVEKDVNKNKENHGRNAPNATNMKRAFGAANQILEEVYTASNKQSYKKMEILRPYSSFP